MNNLKTTKTSSIKGFGPVVSHADYVSIIPNGDSATFNISESKVENFNQRLTLIGLHEDKIILASAVSYDSISVIPKLFGIAKNKLESILSNNFDINPNMKGTTWCPLGLENNFTIARQETRINSYHTDNFYQDPKYFYINNIYGPIYSDVMEQSVAYLQKQRLSYIKMQKKKMFNQYAKIRENTSSS